MEVVPGNHVTPTGEHLGVPAIGESIRDARVRSAVKEEGQRTLFRFIETRRIANPHLDRLAFASWEGNAFVPRQPNTGEQGIVESGQLHWLAVRVEADEGRWLRETLSQSYHGASGARHGQAGEALLLGEC